MKRLMVLPVVVFLCLGLAVPSSAFYLAGSGGEEGSLGVSGYYTLSGEKQDYAYGGTETTWAEFYDDFELSIRASKGDFAAVADLSMSDTEGGDFQAHNSIPVIVDNYWMEWAASDNITLKVGEYALNFGRSIGVYDAGGHNIGVSYRMDAVDIGLTIGKVEEGRDQYLGSGVNEDQDLDQVVVTASTKDMGPFTNLEAIYVLETDQKGATGGSVGYFEDDSYTATFIGLDFALPVGPVAISCEYGNKGGERSGGYDYTSGRPIAVDQKGNYIFFEVGFDKLMPEGFGLTATIFNSSKDYTGPFTDQDNFEAHYPGGNLSAPSYLAGKRGPIEILFDEVNPTEAFTQAVILSASYAWSDRLSFYANLVPLAKVNGDQDDVDFSDYLVLTPADSGDSWGTEYDLGVVYTISKSISYLASYAKFTEGDVEVGDVTQYYNSLTFTY